MTKTSRHVSFFLLLTLVLSACNMPGGTEEPPSAGAVLTAAAQTVEANLTNLTQSAAQSTATPQVVAPTSTTAPPTVTLAVSPTTGSSVGLPSATSDCDDAEFVTDVTIPDGTVLDPGEDFTKTWRLRNSGTCSWTSSYAVVFSNGDSMGGPASQALTGNVNPGQTVDISVNLEAPDSPGTYRGDWQLRNAAGNKFGTNFYVEIKVDGDDGTFAVTGVKNIDAYYISGRGAAFSAEITANNPGEVQYHWIVRESGHADLETAVTSVNFSAAGAKDASLLWTGCPHSGSFTVSIYIDNPNHQEFGSANFSCP